MERAHALPRSEWRGPHERNEARRALQHHTLRSRGRGLLDPGQVRRIAAAGVTGCEYPLCGIDRRGPVGIVGTVGPDPTRTQQGTPELRAACNMRTVLGGAGPRSVGLRVLRSPTPSR
ncbi:hypothetical protein NDU88_003649 [Pleurodeles waltl]|uniref:Uncharacterized protein n=1 Tax=Pleurodeles waltl TaxID=8319 RepID=A0AAV7MED6_PLEWA|nr:hypothetical protein NDU88_003649 [Pleurodeles waltl]